MFSTFYRNTGSCRHGMSCARVHNRPTESEFVTFYNLYSPPEEQDTEINDVNNKDEKKDKMINKVEPNKETEIGSETYENATDAIESKNEDADADADLINEEPNETTKFSEGVIISGGSEPSVNIDGDIDDDDDVYYTVKEVKKVETPEEKLVKFDKFYKDVFIELSLKYGKIKDIIIACNKGIHLRGNVLVNFYHPISAARCVEDTNSRWFNSKPIFSELSPVKKFDDAICKPYVSGDCSRGDSCNFIHVQRPSETLAKDLYLSQKKYYQDSDY